MQWPLKSVPFGTFPILLVVNIMPKRYTVMNGNLSCMYRSAASRVAPVAILPGKSVDNCPLYRL